MRPQSSGFTLIELLISISIIGILTASLLPNLVFARTKATETVTKAFLRQVATEQVSHFMNNGEYASSVSSLDNSPNIPANIVLLSEKGDKSNFCVAAQHSGGTILSITTNGSFVKGSCS